MEDIRCGHCDRLLARGTISELAIKCPRCKTLNQLRRNQPVPTPQAPSLPPERPRASEGPPR
ncbi:MAG: Com family DNA-binding transcriptional regulator [Azospirillum sp.]|nr:Com family DNA-binding transcriptional regulator [Azospirillum sp.]